MDKNLTGKMILVIVLVVVAFLTVYPPTKTLKPGIDLAGGISLIYEIDAHGLDAAQKSGLSARMMEVLRRRIDPANIQNLVWRPQGNTRFEIQLPLADAEAREKRTNYDAAMDELLAKNVNPASIIRSLEKSPEQRIQDFNDFAQNSPDKLQILNNLATAYDQRQALRGERDDLLAQMQTLEDSFTAAELDLDLIKLSVNRWINLDEQQQIKALVEILGYAGKLDFLIDYVNKYAAWTDLVNKLADTQTQRDNLATELQTLEKLFPSQGLDPNQIATNKDQWAKLDEQQRTKVLAAFLSPDDKLGNLTTYVKTHAKWAETVEQLTDPETGKNVEYENAKKALDKLNISREQIKLSLEMSPKSVLRAEAFEELDIEFPDRADLIDNVVAAFDEYRPYQGRLDDAKDLQRMLRGAGILEFRILPTTDRTELDADRINGYVESLKTKGPKYASDNKYVWCEVEVESSDQWLARTDVVVAPFGDKHYVLASNKPDEALLHGTEKKDWQLEKAAPSTDRMGRRSIAFRLDEKGGNLFAKVSGKNIGRPLCILLDRLAISAPTIQSRIRTKGEITGTFSDTEINDMVNKLNAGALPARLIEPPISIKTIGPSIGADNRDAGIRAGLIGLAAVLLCMLVYYCIAGSITDVALLMNMLFVLGIMALIRATFTLPGIAAIILTIGMSVDANVLIFERIREEQQKGSSLRIAIRNGYQRAFRTILDANLTTFITAAILFWVASEEIKGFAIVLMLGIISSMFTALFVTRVILDLLVAKRIVKQHLFMLQLIRKPNINWMALRPVFFTISTLLIAAGLFVFFTRDDAKNSKYDIEFTGGTSVVINLKEDVPIQNIRGKLKEIGDKLNNPAIASANVYSINKSARQYEITTTETNKTTTAITFPENNQQTIETVNAAINKTQNRAGGKLTNLLISPDSNSPASFVIATSQLNKSIVKNVLATAFPDATISEPQVDRVVNNAIRAAFEQELQIQQNLGPTITSKEKINEQLVESFPELADFVGGLKIECQVQRPATYKEIDRRFKDLRFKPDLRELNWNYSSRILGSDLSPIEPNEPVKSFVYLAVEREAGLTQLTDEGWEQSVENETTKVLAATQLEASLPRVTQIDPSIGGEAKTRASIAIVLSLLAIIGYIWIRFGNLRYGLGATAALLHDVCITLGAVTACTYIAATPIGEKLLVGDFKIDLAMIAAFLTLIGYSLNDTIVVFDRIRENRRKGRLHPQLITDSINQTLSRTILTSFTTFIVVLIMYIFGGQGLRGFTFAIGFGIITGTYSSMAIAAPILLLGAKVKEGKSSSRLLSQKTK